MSQHKLFLICPKTFFLLKKYHCIWASKCGEDDFLKFKMQIREKKKGDFDCHVMSWLFVSDRLVYVSGTAADLGFSCTTNSWVVKHFQ